jgi:aspartyl-tRNA(Asn)/glutamyl-tRNA(Gln) amidotransferase subunit C
MAITREELKHLADLARLNLSDTELTAMQSDLNRVLDHFARLQALDLAGIDLTPHSVDSHSIWREDTPAIGLLRDEALAGAPELQAGLFLVPTIIE